MAPAGRGERFVRDEHRLTGQAGVVLHRVDGPGAAFARVGVRGAGEEDFGFDAVDGVVDLDGLEGYGLRRLLRCGAAGWPGRRDVDLDAGQAEVAVRVAAGTAFRQALVGQRFEADAP